MEQLFHEIGIPRKYLKSSVREDRFIALVHRSWLRSLIKYGKPIDFIEKSKLDAWNELDTDFGPGWTKIFIRIFKKRDVKVIPLPRMRATDPNDAPLLFPQLLQYISLTNYKNLWKDAYKKYASSSSSEGVKDTQVTLADYNDVLRQIVARTYACPIINTCEATPTGPASNHHEPHLNLSACVCAVETLNAIFLVHPHFLPHNLSECVTFSPAVLEACYAKPLFLIYQLLHCLKALHDRSLTLGEVTLSDIYLTEDLWLQVFPQLLSNLHVQDVAKAEHKKAFADCLKVGHEFRGGAKCVNCGRRTYDKVRVAPEDGLKKLCELWVEGRISNFTYISALNNFAGRKLGDPHCHHVFPWVTDFSTRCGRNWRDLKKSKFRLNKGDRQLDLTYEHSALQVPHHVSDVLSPITYYVYMARRTPKSVLCKNVRTIWVAAEYPSSIQRLQEWTPDECIPEYFTDPSVFTSLHDDLDDLELPSWCSGPEDFIEQHRDILESVHVSERLHHWIDLTFGYKLSGSAAVKSKNVCLQLVDGHTHLTKSGIVQLFTHPHPARAVKSPFWSKTPPTIHVHKYKHKTRDRSVSSVASLDASRSDDELSLDDDSTQIPKTSPLTLTRFLSRSRSSLNEETEQKRGPNPRSSSLGPKNPTFTSHVTKTPNTKLSVQKSSLSTGTIYLPHEYNPAAVLTNLENLHGFLARTFHASVARGGRGVAEEACPIGETARNLVDDDDDNDLIPNAYTNQMFADTFEGVVRNVRAPKAFTYPVVGGKRHDVHAKPDTTQIRCNYAAIVTARRIKELQIVGCLIVEIFMARHLRALGVTNTKLSFSERVNACLAVIGNCPQEIPLCIRYIVNLLLTPAAFDADFKYPTVTDLGLPPPSAHILLEPLLHSLIPFPKPFWPIYRIVYAIKAFAAVSDELNTLYHFDCNGHACVEYENLERTRVLLAQNISECMVKSCSMEMEQLFRGLNPNTDRESIYLLIPHVRRMLVEPSTSVLAAWYLFDPMARLLGPQKTAHGLLRSILKIYETEPGAATIPFHGKIAKLYHHSFLLRLMVRLGLRCFLENFTASLVEAVGGYRDYEKTDFILHTHAQRVERKGSVLKAMAAEGGDSTTPSDDSSCGSESNPKCHEPEVFAFDGEEPQHSLQSLIEQLELNVADDLPFNHSTAEEALDATLTESIEQLKSLEELNLHLNEDYDVMGETGGRQGGVASPTIPIPSYDQNVLMNISCEIGSKKSDNEVAYDVGSKKSGSDSERVDYSPRKSLEGGQSTGSGNSNSNRSYPKTKRNGARISDMSSDSLIWLSHRLGPVLTARYLSRNLLKMLTLCYVGRENLMVAPKEADMSDPMDLISIANSRVVGDQNASNVLDCLASIAALYGEQLILLQYFPHMSELVALCKKRLTPNLEGSLISCLALLQFIIPYLCDTSLMDHLQDVMLKNILLPAVRLLGSTKFAFPNGALARNVLARKFLDTINILSLRMGSTMTRSHLMVPAVQRFFLIFDKANGNYDSEKHANKINRESSPLRSIEESHFVELRRDGTTTEWAVGGHPIQISHVRIRNSGSMESLSPPSIAKNATEASTAHQALDELKAVFTAELAHAAYVPLLKFVGLNTLSVSLRNHEAVRGLCQEFEQETSREALSGNANVPLSNNDNAKLDEPVGHAPNESQSIGSYVAVVGNRLDVQPQTETNGAANNVDVLTLVSNKMANTSRHLRGNWLAYWEHEIGRAAKDVMFNFKQIRLQCFNGHTNSVRCLHTLDNENSFMSGSRDKTVKLWSLRSHGDGASVATCQWTYTAHKKSVLSIAFVEAVRRVASCDSVVHIWDPFMGVNVGHLESAKYPPVNVVSSMPAPSSLVFAATTEGTVRVVDTRLCNYVYDLKVSLNPTGLIRCLAVSPSGQWVATGQSSGQITVLDSRTGLVIATWRGHENEVLQMVVHGENTLISSGLDQMVSVWDVHSGRPRFGMKGAAEPVHCLNMYNGELISGTTANRIGVHTSIAMDASYSSTKLRSDTFKGLLTSMAVLPLNRLLLLGADSGNISLLC